MRSLTCLALRYGLAGIRSERLRRVVNMSGTVAALDALWSSALYSQFSHRRATILFVAGLALVQVAIDPSFHSVLRGAASRAESFARRRRREAGVAGVRLAALVVLAVSAATSDSRGRRQGIQESRYRSIGRFIAQELDRATRIGFWGTNQSHLRVFTPRELRGGMGTDAVREAFALDA